MAFNITDACVKCGACADQCPVEAISEGDEMYVIDADTCVNCGFAWRNSFLRTQIYKSVIKHNITPIVLCITTKFTKFTKTP